MHLGIAYRGELMPAVFVHVSDIHFGQEKDDKVHIHADVKQQLITDVLPLTEN